MIKNIMCVCASGDTANIGIYEVDVFGDKIESVKFIDWKETIGLKFSDVSDLIIDLCDVNEYFSIIVDCRSFGICIVDELEKVRDFVVPIFKYRSDSRLVSNGIILFKEFIKNKNLIIENEINIDINILKLESNFKLNGGGFLSLNAIDYKNQFSNIIQLFSTVENCVLNNKTIKNKTIFEKNLRENLEILVEDLYNLEKSDPIKVNDLIRLIDKVNYIRGQY